MFITSGTRGDKYKGYLLEFSWRDVLGMGFAKLLGRPYLWLERTGKLWFYAYLNAPEGK